MSTGQTLQIDSTSLDDTLALAAKIGSNVRGGEVIELVSDLGGGKTSFVRGLARGMGSDETVHSPSFTVTNEYRAGDLTLYHFDFYRLQEPGLLSDELVEVLHDPQAVVAIEWATIVEAVLLEERITIRITATGEQTRHFECTYPDSLRYMMQGVA